MVTSSICIITSQPFHRSSGAKTDFPDKKRYIGFPEPKYYCAASKRMLYDKIPVGRMLYDEIPVGTDTKKDVLKTSLRHH